MLTSQQNDQNNPAPSDQKDKVDTPRNVWVIQAADTKNPKIKHVFGIGDHILAFSNRERVITFIDAKEIPKCEPCNFTWELFVDIAAKRFGGIYKKILLDYQGEGTGTVVPIQKMTESKIAAHG
jgi:hypothetical protein